MSRDPDDLLASIAAELLPQVGALSAALTGQIVHAVPQLAGDGPLIDALGASVADNVATLLRLLAAEQPAPVIDLPAAALEYARRLAQRGVAINALLRAYRIGQANFQQTMITRIAAAGLDAEAIAAAVSRLSTIAFDYIDLISEGVAGAYQQERDGWVRQRIAARTSRVLALLGGGGGDGRDSEKALGYPLECWHSGIVAWPAETGGAADQLPRLERAVARLADATGVLRAPLQIAPDETTVWAWLPRATAAPPVLADVDDAVRVAIGEPGHGVDGFRATHREARHAQAISLAAGPAQPRPVTAFADVAPIALMSGDLDSVARWVQRTLGELGTDREPMARLRHTLANFLANGASYTASAQQLHLHKNTVQYRIRKAEEALPRPLAEQRLAVELALRASQLLGCSVLTADADAR